MTHLKALKAVFLNVAKTLGRASWAGAAYIVTGVYQDAVFKGLILSVAWFVVFETASNIFLYYAQKIKVDIDDSG